MSQKLTYGAVEAGGTKFVCAIGTSPTDIYTQTIETTTPNETLEKVNQFFLPTKEDMSAIGIGSFGPIDIDKKSESYGCITSTPKPHWKNTNIVDAIQSRLNLPVAFDTDVNAAALGEHKWGALQGLSDAIYLTIGTGIGGGAITNGSLVHGLSHPEMGHIFLPKHKNDHYTGKCPFHHHKCFEGLASGPAIEARWGVKPELLESAHPAWELESYYIAHALTNYICTLSPQRIILGGGVMMQKSLLPMIREKTQQLLNGYVRSQHILENIEEYIVAPGLGNRSGISGALELAKNAAMLA